MSLKNVISVFIFIYFLHAYIYFYFAVSLTLCINNRTKAIFWVPTVPENVGRHGRIMAKNKIKNRSHGNFCSQYKFYFQSEKCYFSQKLLYCECDLNFFSCHHKQNHYLESVGLLYLRYVWVHLKSEEEQSVRKAPQDLVNSLVV